MIKRLWQLNRSERWKMWAQIIGQWCGELLVVSVVWAGAEWILSDHVDRWWFWLIGAQLLVTVSYWLSVRRLNQNGWAVAASQALQKRYLTAYLQTTGVDETSVMKVLHQDLSTLKKVTIFFDTIIPTIIQLTLTGIVALVIGIVVRPLTVLIPIAGILLLGMGMGMLQGLGDRKNLAFIASFNAMGQRFLDDFRGMATLIMYQRQHQYADDFEHDTEHFRQKTMGVLEYQLQSLTIMDFCLYGAIGFFLLAQGHAVVTGSLALSTAIGIGTLMAVWLIDFRKFGYFMHVFMSTLPKLKHVFSVIDTGSETQVAPGTRLAGVHQIDLSGTVGYDHPLFTVPGLTLTPGRVIGLTGPSGSGKSTLAQILMGRLPLLSGRVIVDQETDLATVAPLAWQQNVAYLGPTTRLFDGTIADNLLMGHELPGWQERLEKLDLCQFTRTLPAGYATPVGENGAQLSPGQRQQVAVARAVLADKAVYIFDEVTSNIDPENADVIMAELQRLAREKVVLLITHRLADLKRLTDLYLVDGQRLVHGDFDSLRADFPAFKTLVAEQDQLLTEAGLQ